MPERGVLTLQKYRKDASTRADRKLKLPVAIHAVGRPNLKVSLPWSWLAPPTPESWLASIAVSSTPNQAKVTIETANIAADQISRTIGNDRRMARSLSVLPCLWALSKKSNYRQVQAGVGASMLKVASDTHDYGELQIRPRFMLMLPNIQKTNDNACYREERGSYSNYSRHGIDSRNRQKGDRRAHEDGCLM